MRFALLASVFVIASCGLAYELIAGSLASYVLGDSVTQFSTIIGVYLAAMGVGSWLSRYVVRGLVQRFIQIELVVGLVGGVSALSLFYLYTYASGSFRVMLYGMVALIGTLVGLEIPLVMRILKEHIQFKDLVSEVLTVDYIGALLVSLLFPLVLAPHLGLVRSAMLFGLLNVAVAWWALWVFRHQLKALRPLIIQATPISLILLAGFIAATPLTDLVERRQYLDEIIFSKKTPYQQITLTQWKDDTRLYLNGNLQFSSRDEYRYHESLVLPGLQTLPWAKRVLVLGGGDGLAVREVLKYPQIESVTLIDLDPDMTRLFTDLPPLRQLNGQAFHSPKVRVLNADAMQWLEHSTEMFDFIVVDFPDPSNFNLGKLYTNSFYRLLERHLSARGMAAIQSTSPMFARKSFWTIVTTLESVGLKSYPYHALVPSFGEWGYVLVGREAYQPPKQYTVPTRYLNGATTAQLFVFPPDMARVNTEVNRLNNQVLVQTFEYEWLQVLR